MEKPTAKAPISPTDEKPMEAVDIEAEIAQEREMGFVQGVKSYPKAVVWSILMSTALVMEGYDTALLKSLFAVPEFVKTYGTMVKKDSYSISAAWQSGLTNGSSVGQLFGLLVAGYLCELIGFRKAMILGLLSATAMIFIQFFASSLAVLQVGQILLGICLGFIQMIPIVYSHEISPLCLRPYMTTYANLSWVLGHLIELGVLRGMLNVHSSWSYRIPFAIQWVWPVILIPCVFFAPDSPWWLVRKGRYEDAKSVLTRLTSAPELREGIDAQVELMIKTTEHERRVQSETSYWACFKSNDLRRTIIVVAAYSIQLLSGNTLRGYSTFYFQQAGLATTQSFNMSIVAVALSLVGMIMAWFLLPYFGRRTVFLGGLETMFLIWMATGAIGVVQTRSTASSLSWGVGGLLLASSFVYDFTLGPISYTFISEIPSSLLRNKSAAIARWVYSVVSIICNIITPYQINKTAWNWGAQTGFFWAGATFLGLLFTFFYIPEIKDRSTLEMDILFEQKVPARKFKSFDVDSASRV